MAYIRIYNLTSIFLWGVAITLNIVAATLFYSKGRAKEKFKEKIIFYGFAINVIGNLAWQLTRLLTYFYIIQTDGKFVGNAFLADISNITTRFDLLLRIGNVTTSVATIAIVLIYELYANYKKFPITIACLIMGAFVIFTPFNISSLLSLILSFVIYVIVYSRMLYLFTKWTDVKNKALSASFFCGFSSVGIGAYFLFPEVMNLDFYWLELGPTLVIVSGLFLVIPMVTDPKRLSNPLLAWYGSTIYTIGIIITFQAFFFTNTAVLNWTIIGLFVMVDFLFLFYYVRKDIMESRSKPQATDEPDVLSMFSRPQAVSEEEITVSKEKRICLVCKDPLSRKMYICPGCNAFYCQRCTDTLENMENQCWVCNTPFNEAKPVIPDEGEGRKEEIEIHSPRSPKKKA
ncbi:MAG: hypothetical protein ACFFCS_04350 [Candidatus Hodarchaeota archaeon]